MPTRRMFFASGGSPIFCICAAAGIASAVSTATPASKFVDRIMSSLDAVFVSSGVGGTFCDGSAQRQIEHDGIANVPEEVRSQRNRIANIEIDDAQDERQDEDHSGEEQHL